MSKKAEAILFISIIGLTLSTRLLHLLNSSYYYIINADSFWFHRQAELAHSGQHIAILGSGLATTIVLSPYILTIVFPIILAFGIISILYFFVNKLYSKSIAIYTSLSFVLLIPAIFITEAGNVDRDALELLLFIPIVFSIYFIITKRHIWISAFVLILYVIMLIILWYPALDKIGETFDYGAAEMYHIQLSQILTFIPFFLPLTFGVRYLWERRQSQDKFLLIWLTLTIIAGCVISRLLLFALPVICIVSGIGVPDMIAKFKEQKQTVALYALVFLTIALAFIFSWKNFADTIMPKYYVNACEYIEENTPEDSLVMTWWSNGNWVYDVAKRDSYVMNTGTGHTQIKDWKTAYVYCAKSDIIAYHMLPESVDYVIFSDIEKHYSNAIINSCHYLSHSNKDIDLEATFWYQALEDNFKSEYFSVIYRDKDIVVLEVL